VAPALPSGSIDRHWFTCSATAGTDPFGHDRGTRRAAGRANEWLNPAMLGTSNQQRVMQMTQYLNSMLRLFVLVLAMTGTANAQSYPNRPITFVVPFAPGGLSDVPARALGAIMQQDIGQSIVVENRPGASGVTGATSVLRAEPDGYTILVNALADVQNLHYLSVPYDPIKDFAVIGMVVDGPPLVLVVNAALPYKSVAELVADARANPNKISFGTSGPATSPAIGVTQINALANTSIVGVPYRGSGAAAVGVATGEVQGAFVFYSNAKPLSDDGKVRALAVASPQRLANWPEIPTMAELGFAGVDHRGFVGLAAPGRTPASIVAFLNKHLNDAINSAAFRARMEPLGMTIPADNTPERFAEFMRRENAKQAELARLSGHSPLQTKP
jgi:tripartite-type tricarboxylate transporter receptor subunit TctC